MMRSVCWALVVVASFSGAASAGDEAPVKKPAAARKAGMPELPPFSPEREWTALDFVSKHHAELGKLLTRLKELNRDEYEQAIRELFQTRERLTAIRTMDKPLYALSLEIWQVESQIKVLAARHAVAAEKNPNWEQELKDLLYKQVDLQRRIVEHNRDKILKSLEGMNANIKLLQDKREEFVQSRFQNLTRIPAKSAPRALQAAPQPAAKGKP